MKVKLWVYWNTRDGCADVSSFDRDLSEWYNSHLILIGTEVVKIADVREPDPVYVRGILVQNLQDKKVDIQAAAHMKIKAIDEKIQELLCLEAK